MLTAENLSKKYGRRLVFRDLSLTIAPGEFVAIMGPSGYGKSTLLNLLSGLDKPSSGTLNAPERTERAFVFQDYNLLESLDARTNAMLTAKFSGRPCTRAEADRVFHDLGLDGCQRQMPAELSGGQQQRVAIARALLATPSFIFADEPTGALDDATATTVLEHLRAAAHKGATVVMVTHSHAAAAAADRIIDMEADHARVA
ncbi:MULTISPECIES: ABC transporter ATP-binding protein [Corynebacterium]|uniref:ABC transporter ATP-binding protein n=1 Tax=Corynebacterium TaxID=1716 RepID=UPI00124D2034|nr:MULTISPECIES: ABC transporter ATP-binding protein [Corynebacterium]